eukprot:9671712-Prorocentrum_lima.AAC.1
MARTPQRVPCDRGAALPLLGLGLSRGPAGGHGPGVAMSIHLVSSSALVGQPWRGVTGTAGASADGD